jgi:hypothetical protein
MAEQAAKVGEMFLIGGGFLALEARPFLFEFSGGHGSVAHSASFSRIGMTDEFAREICQRQPVFNHGGNGLMDER